MCVKFPFASAFFSYLHARPVTRALYPQPALSRAAAGFIANESEDADILRTNWILEKMSHRQDEYSKRSSLT